MSTFTVVEGTWCGVILSTDDWVEAEALATSMHSKGKDARVRGTHPTHVWGPPRPEAGDPDRSRRCARCDGWDNGSYGSHLPCGYDHKGRALVTIIEDELRARKEAASDGEPAEQV